MTCTIYSAIISIKNHAENHIHHFLLASKYDSPATKRKPKKARQKWVCDNTDLFKSALEVRACGEIISRFSGQQAALFRKGYRVQKLKTFFLAGKQGWRLPSIKELYSLALFSGVGASSRDMAGVPPGAKLFITSVFDFQYGANGNRPIDTQLLSSTIYQGKTMGGQETVFGFNAADGRIKGYPMFDPHLHSGKQFTVRFVRGDSEYGKDNYHDNQNGTISDLATGLMWEKSDSGKGMNWQEALDWVAQKNGAAYLGYMDWRLPNPKELQSIVDYSRCPQKTASPAISPMFEVSAIMDEAGRKNYPFYWTSTTHQSVRGGFEIANRVKGSFELPLPTSSPPRRNLQHAGRRHRSIGNGSIPFSIRESQNIV